MLLVGVVVCMLGQYWVFPPLATIIAARRRGILATRRCKHSTGISAHLSSMACWSSPRLWGGLSTLMIHPKYVLWVCSLAIFQAAPSSWRCPAEENQRLHKHCEVWGYRLGNCSCCLSNGTKVFHKNAPVVLTRELFVGDHNRRFAKLWKAPQTCNKPPPTWTL